jgi:ankyrin repeat protein
LEQGASATNTRVDGITALITASVAGHTAAVQMLLEVDADPSAGDQDGLTPLMNAAENGTVAILQYLTQAVDDDRAAYLNAISNTGFNALIIASAHGHADAVEYLSTAGANPEAAAAKSSSVTLLSITRSNKSSTTTASRSDFWNSPRNKQSRCQIFIAYQYD